MKKKNLLLALLSSSLILASCGDDKTDDKGSTETGTSQAGDSNATSGDPTGTSEPEISVDTRTNQEKVNGLFALMAQGKTSTFEYEGYKTEYYGDDKGTWTTVPANDEGYTDYGVAVIPNYGIYQIEYDEDSDEMYLSSILTPNAALKIGDISYTTKVLGAAAANVTWTESSRTHTFSTTDTTFCGVMMCMLGLDDYVDSYGGMKASFVVNEAGTAITNLSLALTSPTVSTLKAVTIEGMKISKVNETMNLDFEVLIANSQITARTAWSQYELAYFTTYIHASFALPFPTGASYAINETVTQKGVFVFMDYGCGNLVNSYKTQLETAGFTVNDDLTNNTTGVFGYEKTLVAASGTTGPIKEYVKFTWNNDATQAKMYPNGVFVIQAYVAEEEITMTLDEIATIMGPYALTDGSVYWPDLSMDECTGVNMTDLTDAASQYYQKTFFLYATFKFNFPTAAEANSAVSYITTQLGKIGYYWDSYYEVWCLEYVDYTTYVVEYVDVTIEVAYDENNTYLGYVYMTMIAYEN